MKPKITLTSTQMSQVTEFAKARQAVARGARLKDQNVSIDSSLQIDIQGMASEMAFGIFAKLKPYHPWTGLRSAKKGRGAWDFEMPNGISVDVKSTPLDYGSILVKLEREVKDVEAYVLVTGLLSVFTIHGWCWARDIILKCMEDNPGRRKCYMMKQRHKDFQPIWDLCPSLVDEKPKPDLTPLPPRPKYKKKESEPTLFG